MKARRFTTHSSPGCFITFEGIEGSGKSTQLARLGKRLREEGYRVIETREPGGTPIAEEIRNILLRLRSTSNQPRAAESVETMTPECEALLVFAARNQHVRYLIRPALEQGAVVLCDRFSDSTFAYQGYARGLDLTELRRMNRVATGNLIPDLTLLFDLPVVRGLARRRRDGMEQNRLDRETRRFHERVRQGFLSLARKDRRRITVLDAARDAETIADDVAALVLAFLKKRCVG